MLSTLNLIMMLQDRYDISVFALSHEGPVKEQYRKFDVLPEDKLLSFAQTHYNNQKHPIDKFFCLIMRSIQRIVRMLDVDINILLCKNAASNISRKYRFDVIASCQEGYPTIMASFFTNATRIAWFRTQYSIYRNMLPERVKSSHHELYMQFDKIVFVSQTTSEEFLTYFPDFKQKTLAIHNIQETEHIINLSNENIKDAFDSTTFNIVSVGRFAKAKRFSLIPEIASKIKATSANIKWYIIGDGNDDEEFDKTISNIQKYKIENEVIYLGRRINPYPYISKADLVVLTSYYEACPRVVVESKILHTPVVCADFSSATEFVTNDVDGYVDKIDNLPKVISNLVHKPESYNRIKHQCDQYIFNAEIIKRQLYSLFD